jgi:hypothetical protein
VDALHLPLLSSLLNLHTPIHVHRMLSRIARSTARRAPAWAPRVQPRYAPARDPPLGTLSPLLLGKPRSSSSLTPGPYTRRAFSSYVEGEAPTSLYTLTEEEIMLKDLGQSLPLAAAATLASSRSWFRPRHLQCTDTIWSAHSQEVFGRGRCSQGGRDGRERKDGPGHHQGPL